MLKCLVLLYLSTVVKNVNIFVGIVCREILEHFFFHRSVPTFDHRRFLSWVKLYTQLLHMFFVKLSAFVCPKLFWFSLWLFENLLERVCDRFSSFVFERKHPTIFWKHVNHCEKTPDPTVELWKCLDFDEICSPDFIDSVDIHFSFWKIFDDGFGKFIS